MGQVIAVDFGARGRATSNTQQDDRPRGPVPAAAPALPAGRIPHDDAGPDSLEARCQRMRADSAKLQAAVADLQRAVADLGRLPALARELCDAAI